MCVYLYIDKDRDKAKKEKKREMERVLNVFQCVNMHVLLISAHTLRVRSVQPC